MRKYSKSIMCLLVGLALYAGIESTYADPDLSKPALSKTAVVKELTEADKEELVPKKDNDTYIIERSSKEERLEAEKNKEKQSSRSVMFFPTQNKTKQDFTAPTPVINNVSAKDAFYQIVAEKGLSESEINGWAYTINRESSWRVNAKNPSSGAYGLPQALPGNKMASHGADWQTNPYTQLRWMYDYMIGRYGSIQGAVNFWNKNHWY